MRGNRAEPVARARGRDVDVVVAAGSQVWLSTLGDALRPAVGVRVVGYAMSADDVLRLDATARPDVVVLDEAIFHALPAGGPGAAPRPRLVLVASSGGAEQARAHVASGADAVLSRTASRAALVGAIRAVTAGGSVAVPVPGGLRVELTERELDVLQGVVLAWSNVEIADSLSVSVETVKTHISTLLRKLACRNRVDLALRACVHGLGVYQPQPATGSPGRGRKPTESGEGALLRRP